MSHFCFAAIFVNNVFEQTVGQEINLSCNQVGCRVLEMLLPLAKNETLQCYMEAFSNDMRPLCGDRFASHVLEALVNQVTHQSIICEDDEFKTTCKSFIQKVAKFLLNNLEDYIWDQYANHVIRTCLINLAQIPKENGQKETQPLKNRSLQNEMFEPPSEYIELVTDYAERIIHWPQFNELCNLEITSGFLQVLLRALRKVNKNMLKKYLDKLISENFTPEGVEVPSNMLPSVFLSKPLIMLMEVSLEIAKSKTFTKIYVKCFSGRLAKLSTIKNTNFTVQKLIANIKEKAEVFR